MRYEQAVRDTFTVTSVTGQEALCMCPWHDDTSEGHLYVNLVKGLYICFSCGEKGNLDNLSLPRTVLGTDDVRERLERFRAKKRGQKVHYHPESWLNQFDNDHPYWSDERDLPDSVIRQFRLGYDPFSNRCTIPLRDARGRVLGVTYRRLDDQKPKYLEPRTYPKGRHLWAAWEIEDQKTVALVEGQMDAVRGWASRVPALALMGARITRDQIKVLQSLHVRTVVLMMDNDTAGIKGTLQVHEMLRGSGIRVKVGVYRDYWVNVKDPDGLTATRYRKMFHSAVRADEWASSLQ